LSRALSRFLTSATRNYDLVHIHGTMHFPSFAACAAARAADVPYVVSPLGSVQPWSLAQKRWKKLPYWTLIEHRNLKGAAALHAASEREADAIRALLPNARVILSPRGMEPLNLPIVERSPRKIVFLGRIHKVKGFDVLIPALSQVCAAMPGVETVFAGPDDDGEWRRVVRLLENSRPRPAFRYIGAVSGDEKWRLLATSTVLVLPSHTENFGMAVLEALACGTPVVASKNTPWSAVEERGAGFWVTNSPDQLASALVAILGNPALASRMGKAALALAKEYSWPTIGVEMLRTYRGILSSRSG
jgi:glycosyltransferase involved in cell wall biosynthesis